MLSEIPFYHPVGAVRVGLIDGEVVFNPPNSQRDVSDLDLVVVGTEEAVVMVEAGANQISEDVILDCIFQAHQEIQKIIRAQHELYRAGQQAEARLDGAPALSRGALRPRCAPSSTPQLKAALFTKKKFERKKAVGGSPRPYLAQRPRRGRWSAARRSRRSSPASRRRSCARWSSTSASASTAAQLDEIRDITIEVGLLPRTHGSALFTRGETQALVTVTLGTGRDAQIIEEYEGESVQKFMLHYNFPPFSVGEVKFLRGPGRREIGHGVLARRALLPVLPARRRLPLHGPRGLRHPGVERLLVDGHRSAAARSR